jgi:serine protease Do
MVKLYGAGGIRGLEPYQSGFLVSGEGHILTVWSYVLDTDYVSAVLHDGRKFEARLLGADPTLELAVLKIEAQELPHFELRRSAEAAAGTRVLAFSNLFGVASGDEPASVQRGVVAVRTQLDARRGAFTTPYRGPVYVLDAMTNNPGAAGGALTNQRGELVAMLGKELRNALNNTWLNYAIPAGELGPAVEEILAGKFRVRTTPPEEKPEQAADLESLGIVLVPDVLERTPPFVDAVRPGSLAAEAGVRADDLVVFVGERLVQSCKALREELSLIEKDTPFRLLVMRDGALVEVSLGPRPAAPATEVP